MHLIGMQREQVYSYGKVRKKEASEKTRLQQHVTSAKAMRDGHVAMLDISLQKPSNFTPLDHYFLHTVILFQLHNK